MSVSMSPKQRFLAAIQGQKTDHPALGTVTSLATIEAMNASGASFPEVHHDPVLMARLAAFCSLDAGFDMIFPLFSVVHDSAALGADVDWGDHGSMPGIVQPLWKEAEDITIPADFEQQESMAVACEAIRLLKAEYGDRYAIVGKTFGPWSLGFHLFGVEEILVMTIEHPEKLKQIFTRLLEVTMRSALAQIRAGADTLCLGDHCSREMCSPDTYREFLFPLHQELARRIPCPIVLHTCGDTSDRIDLFAQTGLRCFHYDTRVPAQKARELAGDRLALMGGVSNIESLLRADEDNIRRDVQRVLTAGINVIGPECAIPLSTKLSSLRRIGEACK